MKANEATAQKSAIEKYVLQNGDYRPEMLRKKLRLLEVLTLTELFNRFSLMHLHRSIAVQKNPSYQEAERSADMFNAIFDMGMKTEDFFRDKNEESEKSLAEYEKFKEVAAVMTTLGYDMETILAFCKRLEYSYVKGLGVFKYECNLHYQMFAEYLCNYITGFYSYEEMARGFVEINVFKGTVKPASRRKIVGFIKSMLRVHEVFHEIYDKRVERAMKKRQTILP